MVGCYLFATGKAAEIVGGIASAVLRLCLHSVSAIGKSSKEIAPAANQAPARPRRHRGSGSAAAISGSSAAAHAGRARAA